MQANYTTYDAALESLAPFGPSLSNGLVNHAPMVAESLARLGRKETLEQFVDTSEWVMRERPAQLVTVDNWTEALGDRERYSDWSTFLRARLQHYSWQAELRKWLLRLLPGSITAACHALLRCAHVVRALQQEETVTRKNELADAMAMWAAHYRELPIKLLPLTNELSVEDALLAIPLVPEAHKPERGFIVTGAEQVIHAPYFEENVSQVSFQGELVEEVDALIQASAGLLLEHAHSDYTAIVFTHAVTSSAALVPFQSVLPETTQRLLLLRVWQGVCALKSAFAAFDDQPFTAQPAILDPVLLVDAAVSHGDDHVIKLTEACVSTWRRCGNDRLLLAADRVRQLLPPN